MAHDINPMQVAYEQKLAQQEEQQTWSAGRHGRFREAFFRTRTPCELF